MESPTSQTIDLSKTFTQLIQILIGSLRMLLIITISCVALGLVYFQFSPRTFESKMIIQSDILSESYSLKIADNINTHIHDKDFDYLASKLDLTIDEASQLKEFKIASALTPMSQQMAEKEKIIVIISVRVADNAILDKLQKGIVQYLISNEYVKKRVEENKKELENLIGTLDREIKMLDTLKIKISHGKFVSAKVGDVLIADLGQLYGVSAALYEKKYTAMNKLATSDSIQVIEELTPYGKPVWPKLSIVLLISLVFAGIISSVIIGLRSLSNPNSTPAS